MNEHVTFGEFAGRWLEKVVSVSYKQTAVAEYESLLRLHLLPALGDRRLREITPEEMQGYLAKQVEVGLSPRTTINHLMLLRRMFRTAVEWGLLDSNPAIKISKPRVGRPERTFLTAQEMGQLIEATVPSWRLLIALPCLTSARKAECLALSWDAASIENRAITYRRSIRRGVIYDSKTPASRATVPLPASLVPLFEERRAKAPDPERGLVCCRADGSPLSDSKPNAVLNAALAKAGLPHVRFHDLRRSWCIAHIQAGTPIKTILALGRWKSAQTFLDEYAEYLPVSGADATETLDRLVGGEI